MTAVGTDVEAVAGDVAAVAGDVAAVAAVAGDVAAVGWDAVCATGDIPVERGVAALLGDVQVAIFRTYGGELFAVGNQDPFTGAFVLSRGIVGTRGDIPTVASPLHKQVFDLRTGRCLESPEVAIPTYPVRERAGRVEVHVGARAGRAPR